MYATEPVSSLRVHGARTLAHHSDRISDDQKHPQTGDLLVSRRSNIVTTRRRERFAHSASQNDNLIPP